VTADGEMTVIETQEVCSSALYLYVTDADATLRRAFAATILLGGGSVTREF
jgi:hypothetical protein